MKTKNNISTIKNIIEKYDIGYGSSRAFGLIILPVLIAASLALTNCKDSGVNTDDQEGDPVVVEVKASHNHETGEHLFETDTKEVPSGWVTFRFINATEYVHFLFLDHLPGDKTVEDQKTEIFPIFQEAMYLIMEGKDPNKAYAKLPAWSADIVYRGGPGFLSGGNTIETTVFLPSGNYVMECYVKNDDGTYHYTNGMAKGLTVTEESSDAKEPTGADIRMNLSSDGFGIEGEMTAGQHTVAVTFNEKAPGLFGYDVHLARLDEDTDIKTVTTWMDGFLPDGQVSTLDSPAPAYFLGGAHDMPVGNTAYFSVNLEPGRYAWVMEQAANASIYEEFTILNQSAAIQVEECKDKRHSPACFDRN